MTICLMCDLHLPRETSAQQYKVLEWAIADASKKSADCIVYVGDVTCDGNAQVYRWFLQRMQNCGIPCLFIPGNSDLRDPASRDELRTLASPCMNEICGVRIYAVNDCDGTVDAAALHAIDQADENSILFMHHPPQSLRADSREALLRWRSAHPKTMLFHGHLHQSEADGCTVSLQAMDPDKAIGECPCITYYDTGTRRLRKAYHFSPVPTDLPNYFGVSSYDIRRDLAFAAANHLPCLELRPNCASFDADELTQLVNTWRHAGGRWLSIHLPEIAYENGQVRPDSRFQQYMTLAVRLQADRLTQHVPMVSVASVKKNPSVLEAIGDFLASQFNALPCDVVIGVENMHMTAQDSPDDTRRFGYVPEECLAFMQAIAAKCRHRVGINFDIGHARNNAPYSQRYQISTWLAMVGQHIVGYHMHQVTLNAEGFHNHMPITDVYGKLISYASFFDAWHGGQIAKAPVIFEMRPEGAYQATLEAFRAHTAKRVADIHSHTRYSFCGRDEPQALVDIAVRNGLSVLGICDHNYGIGTRKAAYLAEMRALAHANQSRIRLLCGIEVATQPHLYDIPDPAEIRGYDYCLLEHIDQPESLAAGDLFGFCRKLGIPCGIAHTDLFAYCDQRGLRYEDFFRQMAEQDIFWEMNVSYDSIHHYHEHPYVLTFITTPWQVEIIRRTGVRVSVGFDSHRLEDYDGFKVHQMYDFLRGNRISTVDDLLFPDLIKE